MQDTKGEYDTGLNRKSAIRQQLMQENNILQSLTLTADIMETHDVIQAVTIVWAVETEKGKKNLSCLISMRCQCCKECIYLWNRDIVK